MKKVSTDTPTKSLSQFAAQDHGMTVGDGRNTTNNIEDKLP
jgi:hypothetical protein